MQPERDDSPSILCEQENWCSCAKTLKGVLGKCRKRMMRKAVMILTIMSNAQLLVPSNTIHVTLFQGAVDKVVRDDVVHQYGESLMLL